MAPTEANIDYYAVLEISNLSTIDIISKSYRRLVLLRHPDKNPNADSTAMFQLVSLTSCLLEAVRRYSGADSVTTKLQTAYETLRDPTQRRAYDIRWPGIRQDERARQESERRQAEAVQAEQKRAAETRARRQEVDNARQGRIRNLEAARRRHDDAIFELSRPIRKLVADLKCLKDQEDEYVRQEKQKNSWWTYLASPIYGKLEETEAQKQERETNCLNRGASKRIKGSELAEKEARLQRLQEELRDVNGKIAAEKRTAEDEKSRVEEEARARKLRTEQEARAHQLRTEQEARKRAMQEMRERMAKVQRERAESERAARETREAKEALERAAIERRRREAEETAQAMRRRAEEVARKPRDERSGVATKSTCGHDRFWPKVEGIQQCEKCHAVQRRFAFQCPGCRLVACASCRQSLRGETRKRGGVSGRQYRFASHDDYDHDIPSYEYD